ncbi:phosphopentomutase [Nisaea acidiphila]|uniref:Phosphopentomutase n=1 Tax=Nisaea acidiphila TaxID=1862145 RepID=A0A9J7AM75_9PROT|nr:phosphopentomutase [Nisaea acidiphila]UUX48271.1 phosphopentomutase [Nisaea acidiphila]
MRRAFLIVLDSVGIGGAPDAAAFGDTGSDTVGHIAEACASGHADNTERNGPLRLPNLCRLGLGSAAEASTGRLPPGLSRAAKDAAWGYASETSNGKDTPSGHWELSGVPVSFDWGYFPETEPCFPRDLMESLVAAGDLPGWLGDRHASGTVIIQELGEEHIRTGKPIVYTSADSVLQIAAHEEHFGLERLLKLCETARELVDPLNIGRVIARPFVGDTQETFKRTANRRDYSVLPPEPTLLRRHADRGGPVISVGKIGDIFAHDGTGREVKAPDNDAMFDLMLDETKSAGDGALMVVNFVDFDVHFGHRRDPAGYAAALEQFDRRLPEFEALLGPGDLAAITADHGCDPTWKGSDHTRENVPVLLLGGAKPAGPVGHLASFADVGQSLARHLGISDMPHGRSFLKAA